MRSNAGKAIRSPPPVNTLAWQPEIIQRLRQEEVTSVRTSQLQQQEGLASCYIKD